MNWLEKEYKDRFDGASSLEGVNENDMWDVISDSLDEEQGLGNKENKKKRRFVIFFIFLSCGLTGLFFGFNNNTDKREIISNLENEINSSQFNQFFIEYKSYLSNQINKTIVELENSKNTDEIEIVESEKTNNNSKKIGIVNFNKDNDIVHYFEKNVNNKEIIDLDKNSNLNTLNTGVDKEKTTIIFNEEVVAEAVKTDGKPFPSLLELSQINYELIDKINLSKEKIKLNSSSNKTKFNYKVGGFVGANHMKNYYKENSSNIELDDKLKESHQAEIGFSSAVKVFIESSNNYFFATGLEYHSVQSEFNIIHYSLSKMIRDGTNELVSATAERTISHNNRYKFISIPLEVGTKAKFNKFEFGISAGIGFNYMILQQGKTINADDEILELDNSLKTTIPYKKSFLSYQINPFVGYEINDQLSLRLSPTMRFQNHGKSEVYQLKKSSILTGLNFGVLMSL